MVSAANAFAMRFGNAVYLDIQTLLDFRLGALNLISPEFAVEVSTKPEYFLRETDAFESDKVDSISNQPFGRIDAKTVQQIAHIHAQRVMKNSLKTKIDHFVSQLCIAHLQAVIAHGIDITVEVDINTWPCALNQVEKKVMLEGLHSNIGQHFKINFIHCSPDELTLEQVRLRYFALVMYDCQHWVNAQEKAMRALPLRETCLYVPRLFMGEITTEVENELEKYKQNKTDPFQFWQNAISPILPLQFVPVAFFCANIPENDPRFVS